MSHGLWDSAKASRGSSSTTRKPRTLPLTSLQMPLLHFTSATTAGSSGSGGMASVCMTPRSPRTQTSCPRRTSSPSSRRTAPEDAHPCRMPCRSLSLAMRLVASSEELSWGLLGHFLEFPPRSPSWELSPLPGLSLKDAAPTARLRSGPRAHGASAGCVRGQQGFGSAIPSCIL
eukprot:bmy_05874T0